MACNIHGHEARLRSYRLLAAADGAAAAGAAAGGRDAAAR